MVKSGDVVRVKVLDVDIPRKRISLTLRLDDETPPGADGQDPTARAASAAAAGAARRPAGAARPGAAGVARTGAARTGRPGRTAAEPGGASGRVAAEPRRPRPTARWPTRCVGPGWPDTFRPASVQRAGHSRATAPGATVVVPGPSPVVSLVSSAPSPAAGWSPTSSTWYIDTRCLRLDLRILLEAVVMVLGRDGITAEGAARTGVITPSTPVGTTASSKIDPDQPTPVARPADRACFRGPAGARAGAGGHQVVRQAWSHRP